MKYSGKTAVLILLILLNFLHYSCQRFEEESVILLSPYDLYINSQPSKVVSITVNCSSPNDLEQFIVRSQIEGSFSKKELDTLIHGKTFYYKYEFFVPEVIDSSRIILEFTLRDATSKIVNNIRVLQVNPVAKLLTEHAGYELFSGNSGKPDSYNLVDGVPLFSFLGDHSKLHISDTSDSNILLKRWVSPAHSQFVRFNGFDYPNCTNVSIRNAFNAGIKTAFVDNLNQGDIILAKTTDAKASFIAIKIVSIIDNDGSEWDRYIFNIKK